MEGFIRNEGTKSIVKLTAAQVKRYGKALKDIMKLKKKIASVDPIKTEMQLMCDELKAELLIAKVDEIKDKNAVAIVAFPSTTDWNIESLMSKLTGDELDELCPRQAKKGILTARKMNDEEFADRVHDCYQTQESEPTLTVKAA